MSKAQSNRYREAGVNIDAGDELIRRIAPLAEETRIPGSTSGLGGFGGIFDLDAAGLTGPGVRLVSGTDGVGTKLKLAFMTGKHDTIGIDCVAMCVNDILAVGARPLFFLDYFATGKLSPDEGEAVVSGIVEGCRQARCWLMGGETAEMPGMYDKGEYDLAGFVVGAVTTKTEILPEHVEIGDVVIGVPSSGLHSNGFSLARRVLLDEAKLSLDTPLDGDELPLGERMLTPTHIYVNLIEDLLKRDLKPHAVAHITGGGLWENPQRSIPKDMGVELDVDALRELRQPIFDAIATKGEISETEMYRVFNMGVGLTLTVAPEQVEDVLARVEAGGESGRVIGRVVACEDGKRVRIAGLA